MNFKVEKYRDLMEEDKRKRRNYALAAICLFGISAYSLMRVSDEATMLYLESLLRLPIAASIITASLGIACARKATEKTLTK